MHIGDAKDTDMASEWTTNVRQILKKQYTAVGIVSGGFGSYQWNNVARREWGNSMRKIKIQQVINVSREHAFDVANKDQSRLLQMNKIMAKKSFFSTIDQREIGVVYDPEHERFANYFPPIFPQRNDKFIFTDNTNELHSINIEVKENQISETNISVYKLKN